MYMCVCVFLYDAQNKHWLLHDTEGHKGLIFKA
jgi:hypothetical protein